MQPMTPKTPKKASDKAKHCRNAAIQRAYKETLQTPICLSQQEHVEHVQKLEEVRQHATALQDLKATHAKVQYALEDAEEDFEEALGKANTVIEGFAKTFSPPALPTKAQPSPALPLISGARVDLSAVFPALTLPRYATLVPQSFYIVYHGQNGVQGFFESWN
ncbi:hypothetical protein BT96DRAFT_947310 [Gymnopus androsaceus JB14]|uniref:Uncharacterized protein n=1 Tax=Gymnopus androsaceus JB14 TaxID=1447944 RepID=A0A6A4GUM3_9AGAR|nr:hypothetical protein BT96DRAFT_947310 [Gymnopus androsaceus JB14]